MKQVQSASKRDGKQLYSRIGLASALIMVVVTPLICSPLGTYSAFAVWKVNSFAVAVIGLLLAWLLKCRAEGRAMIGTSYFAVPLIFLMAAYMLATAFSVDHRESIFGSYDRFEGLLVIIGYLLVGLIIPSIITREGVDTLLYAWLLTGILISVYALLQYVGIDLQIWQASYLGNRVFSTLGNPLVLSGYIVLTLPIAYARVVSRRDIISAAFIMLSMPALLFTYSRSGWLAFIVVTLLFIVFIIARARADRSIEVLKPLFLWTFLALLIVIVLVVSLTDDLGSRLISTLDLKSGSTAARLNLWKLTVTMIAERPILGHGPETFLQVSSKFLDLTQQSAEVNTKYDRPHSDVLQVVFSAGLIGLLTYLLFIYAYFSGILRFVCETKESGDVFTVAGLAIGILGYLIAIQFFFSSIAVTPLMWLAIGLTASIVGVKKLTLGPRFSGFVKLAVIGFCALLLLPHALTLASDTASQRATAAQGSGDRAHAVDLASLAVRLSPWQVEYLLRQGQTLEKNGDFDGALLAYKRSIEISPGRYEGYAHLASLYYERKEASNAVYYALKALEKYPLHYESRLIYASMSAVDGEIDIAEENLLQLEKIDPNDFRAYLYLGVLYERTGRADMAEVQLKRALELNPNSLEVRQALVGLGASNR